MMHRCLPHRRPRVRPALPMLCAWAVLLSLLLLCRFAWGAAPPVVPTCMLIFPYYGFDTHGNVVITHKATIVQSALLCAERTLL